MGSEEGEVRSLALTPTWSVATVLTVLVAISLVVERSIHRLGHWLHATKRKPLFHALENMKEELMLLGFLSLILTATSSYIARFCIPSRYYKSIFYPCSVSESKEPESGNGTEEHARKLLGLVSTGSISRRVLTSEVRYSCTKDKEPFVSLEGLEQLHRFIFVMAVTHIFYSCLTMLLAILKIFTWRNWETEAHSHANLKEISRELTMKRQSTFVKYHTSTAWSRNGFFVWVVCFLRQFGQAVTKADYLTLRMGFVTNHNLPLKYDFHSYMIRSMEDEFKQIVGISAPLWGFVIVFMLFNVHDSNLYFWISFIPITLILIVGAKLQHIIATLALESVGATQSRIRVNPRDELFWFSKPQLLLSLIHFILFENAFELASFFWVWWQFGFNSCFISHHVFVYIRLVLGFAVQFLCSYSTLPLYALVTQMGTKFKAALISPKIRESIHGWGEEAKKRRRQGVAADGTTTDDSTVRSTERSTIDSSKGNLKKSSNGCHRDRPNTDEDDIQKDYHSMNVPGEIEMQNETLTTMDSNEDPLLGTVSQYRSVSSVSSQPLEARKKATDFLRSFTQPQLRQ